jgi:hypothetical protein
MSLFLLATLGTWIQTFGQHDVAHRLPQGDSVGEFADFAHT